ncbi:MAG: hypothetical protein ACYCXA_15065 [Actinomycetes bacterium]
MAWTSGWLRPAHTPFSTALQVSPAVTIRATGDPWASLACLLAMGLAGLAVAWWRVARTDLS